VSAVVIPSARSGVVVIPSERSESRDLHHARNSGISGILAAPLPLSPAAPPPNRTLQFNG
jgi:hypothetical protein